MKKLEPRVRIVLKEAGKKGEYDPAKVEKALMQAARTKKGREVLEKWKERL